MLILQASCQATVQMTKKHYSPTKDRVRACGLPVAQLYPQHWHVNDLSVAYSALCLLSTFIRKNKDLVDTTFWCENGHFLCENRSDLHENLFSHQLNCFHTKKNLFQALQTWHVQFTPDGMKHDTVNVSHHGVWNQHYIWVFIPIRYVIYYSSPFTPLTLNSHSVRSSFHF